MRFLLDQNRAPRLAALIRDAGHDAVHTLELGPERASDEELLALAERERRVVVTGDTDFGALLALTQNTSPSVILFRDNLVDDLDGCACTRPDGADHRIGTICSNWLLGVDRPRV